MKPDVRKRVEDMMVQLGIQVGTASDAGAMIAKTGITPEMAARNRLVVGQRGDCTSNTSDRSASGMRIAFKCTDSTSGGDGQVSFSGNAGYGMQMNINTTVAGELDAMTLDGTGKWLGADCGGTKPPPSVRK